jgi:hypothetical protein
VAAGGALVGATALFLLAASSAHAATLPAGPLRFASPLTTLRHTRVLPHSRYFGAPAPIPHASSGFLVVDIATRPVDVTVNDVSYREWLEISEFRDPFGSTQVFIDVAMARLDRPRQLHLYSYSPSDPVIATLARRTLASATVDTGTAIAPDVVNVAYAANTTVTRTACSLGGGRTGYVRSTKGTLTYNQLSIDTTTAPFFGTLTAAGTQARLTVDPGCQGPGYHPPRLQQCPGHVEIDAGPLNGDYGFDATDNYGRTRVFEGAVAGTNSSVKSFFHFGFSGGPITDLPRPRRSATGATAHLRTTAGGILAGSATFTSHHAPSRSVLHRCVSYGRHHSFHIYRYRGVLAPDATPLAALFDTGTLTLAPVSGNLRLMIYSS